MFEILLKEYCINILYNFSHNVLSSMNVLIYMNCISSCHANSVQFDIQ